MVSTAKLASMAVVFVLSCLSGLTPCSVMRLTTRIKWTSKKFRRILSILSCFSGGVFFATCMLNLLPEAQEAMVEVLEALDWDIEFPFTETLVGIGFILVLFIETVAMACCSTPNRINVDFPEIILKQKDSTGDLSNKDFTEKSNGIKIISLQPLDIKMQAQIFTHNNKAFENDNAAETISYASDCDTCDDRAVDSQNIRKQEEGISKLRSIILMIALSIHMLFDGLALGLLDSDTKVWSLLLPICIHKVLVYLSVGLNVSESLNSLPQTTLAIVLISMVSPVGIGIGIALTSIGQDVAVMTTSAVLQGIAVGTFIYVTFFEILNREFGSYANGGIKCAISTALGFGIMAVVKYAFPEEQH